MVLAGAMGWAAPARQVAIVSPALHQFEDGPALTAGHQFVPGETLFFTFQVGGYQPDDERKIHIEYSLDALDARGVALVAPIKGAVETTLADEDKNWLPKERQSFQLPSYLSPGSYQVVLKLKDVLNNSRAEGKYTFTVRGRTVEPSPTLVVRNLHFLRSEDDTRPLTVVAYRPGDAIWARFDITGFRYGPGNQIDVSYGISVLRPNGEVMFSEPNAAQEKDQTFYPKPYVPGVINLNPSRDISPAEYTILLKVQDRIGNQTFEMRCPFRIEK
jgi:hypothetical protein